MRYDFDPRGFVLITASDNPAAETELAVYQEMMADPAFHPGIDILLDNRARSTGADSAHVKKMSRHTNNSSAELQGCRCAIVVENDVEYGMARMYDLISDSNPLRVRVFRVMKEAEDWLASDAEESDSEE